MLFCEAQPMFEMHLLVLSIYDQNTTIQMFVVVFWSFIVLRLLCVVFELYGTMMCVNACICTVLSMCAFPAVYDQTFPCPILVNSGHVEYEQSVLMMGNIPNQTKSMTPVLEVEITNH